MTEQPITDTALAVRRAQALQRLLEGELATRAQRGFLRDEAARTLQEARDTPHDQRFVPRLQTKLQVAQRRLDRTEENIDALQAALAPLRFLLPEHEEEGSV